MKPTPPKPALFSAILIGMAASVLISPAAISLSSSDSFAAGTEGWVEGAISPNPPAQTSDAGRDGSPGHLIMVSDGSGPGGRQLMWSDDADWTGDYLAAGVTGISLWADNRGTGVDRPLRVALDGPGGWFVSDGQALASSSGWTQLEYALADLTHIGASGGTGVLNDTLGAVSRFEILVANGTPSFGVAGDILRGDNVVSDIRIDDITAVPEPSVGLLLVGGLGIASLRRRRRL